MSVVTIDSAEAVPLVVIRFTSQISASSYHTLASEASHNPALATGHATRANHAAGRVSGIWLRNDSSTTERPNPGAGGNSYALSICVWAAPRRS
jgi:hypothetical protein